MGSTVKILAIGDIVGREAVGYAASKIRTIKRELGAELVIVNAENAAKGNGLDPASADELLFGGADVLTSGNHIFQKHEIRDYLDESASLIRPANYPPSCPGRGYTTFELRGKVFLVINVLGTVFSEPLDCPFRTVDAILAKESGKYDFAVLDIHAEATAEKIALANYFDGRIHVIFGTHTHVQTADERILPHGTGYITDLGMTGPLDSVLGVKTECIIRKLTTKMPVRFETAEGNIVMCGALFELDTDSGRVVRVQRVRV